MYIYINIFIFCFIIVVNYILFKHKNFTFSMLENVMKIALDIASKSPVGVQMTKRSIIYSRDHTVQEGLDHIVS